TTADARCFFQQVRRRRSFQFEGERTVAVRSDDHRYRHTGFHTLSLSIERFTEFHDVQTFLTQSRTYRWRRVCFTSCNLQLDVAFYLLSHIYAPYGYQRCGSAPQLPDRQAAIAYVLRGLPHLSELKLNRRRTTKHCY